MCQIVVIGMGMSRVVCEGSYLGIGLVKVVIDHYLSSLLQLNNNKKEFLKNLYKGLIQLNFYIQFFQ